MAGGDDPRGFRICQGTAAGLLVRQICGAVFFDRLELEVFGGLVLLWEPAATPTSHLLTFFFPERTECSVNGIVALVG